MRLKSKTATTSPTQKTVEERLSRALWDHERTDKDADACACNKCLYMQQKSHPIGSCRPTSRVYQDGGGQLDPPGLAELVEQAQPHVWWIWFNVRRELGDDPSPDPVLVRALLSGVSPIDIEALKLRLELFR